jgi:hypothetical protein
MTSFAVEALCVHPSLVMRFLAFFGGQIYAFQTTWMPRLRAPGDLTNLRSTSRENHVNSAASFLLLATYVHGPEIPARDDDVTSNDTPYLVHDW